MNSVIVAEKHQALKLALPAHCVERCLSSALETQQWKTALGHRSGYIFTMRQASSPGHVFLPKSDYQTPGAIVRVDGWFTLPSRAVFRQGQMAGSGSQPQGRSCAACSSRIVGVAEYFGKEHRNVMQTIDVLIAQEPSLTRAEF